MDMLYDYEKNLETTYYIPVTLLTCMQERFPVLMWADMFRISPHFALFHVPRKVFLAIDLCMQGDPSPWKNAQIALEDKNEARPLALTIEPHQIKRPKKESKSDARSETTSWSERPSHRKWSPSGGTWEGWISFPSVGSGSGWWDEHGTDASSHDSASSVSEEPSRGAWETAGYGQSKHRSTSSRGQQGSVVAPWHQKR
jgi:hypothetical protein